MTSDYVGWLFVLSIALLLLVAVEGWLEADEERAARWERIGYRVFGDGPRP